MKAISVIVMSFSLLLCEAAFSQAGNVVIFEQKNFAGRSATLGLGEHRMTDWKPASIRVPGGLIAMLFESVDSAGGFGISVDLMEDHADLSPFGLAGNTSDIIVFPPRDGFIWARNAMVNGTFVPGHWERPRVGGTPANPVALAAPPVPSRVPPAPTQVQQQGATWTITTLGPASFIDIGEWTRADKTMGVIGSDFRGLQEIGSAAFERASNNLLIPDSLNFWYPNKQPRDHTAKPYFKRTLTGVIAGKITKNWNETVTLPNGIVKKLSGTYLLSDEPHVAHINDTYPDHDFNLDITPFADYMHLIRDSHKPEKSTEVEIKDFVDDDHDPCTDPFIKVESEIDAGQSGNIILANALKPRVGKQVAVYGPWIYDIGHCDHPEIHPAEEIWWTENAPNNAEVYHLNVIADASKRFLWRKQMDDGTKLHPWGAPPITGLFAIAFEVPISTLQGARWTEKRFEVTNVEVKNVATVPNANTTYRLVYRGQTLVSFVPHSDSFKVSFENVALKPGIGPAGTQIVRGLLVIETTVGSVKQIATKATVKWGSGPGQETVYTVAQGADPDKVEQLIEAMIFQKEDGHNLFTVTRTDVNNGLVVLK